MIKENESEFNKANITKYQNMTLKKDVGAIVILDSNHKPRSHDNIEIVIDNFTLGDRSGHNTQVCGVTRQVAPDAPIITFNFFGSDKPKIIDWIIKNRESINVVNCSFTSGDKEIERLEPYKDIVVLASSGNTGRSIRYPSRLPWIISIGAYEEHRSNVAHYSSYGERLDALAFTSIYLMVDPESDKIHWFNGTSCSSPVLCGMIWLYQSRMGIKFTREQARQFIHKNSKDLLDIGFDERSGFGLATLPQENVIKMYIGSKVYTVDGVTHTMDVEPIIEDGRTLVPLRAISEAFGCKVEWDGIKKEITIKAVK